MFIGTNSCKYEECTEIYKDTMLFNNTDVKLVLKKKFNRDSSILIYFCYWQVAL